MGDILNENNIIEEFLSPPNSDETKSIYNYIINPKTNLVNLKNKMKIKSNLDIFKDAKQSQIDNFGRNIKNLIKSHSMFNNTDTSKRYNNFKNFLKIFVIYLCQNKKTTINLSDEPPEPDSTDFCEIFKNNFTSYTGVNTYSKLYKKEISIEELKEEANKEPSDTEVEEGECRAMSMDGKIPRKKCKYNTICLDKNGKFIDTSLKSNEEGSCQPDTKIIIDDEEMKEKEEKVHDIDEGNIDILKRFINSIPKRSTIKIGDDEIYLDKNLLQNLILNLRLLTLIPSNSLEAVIQNLSTEYKKDNEKFKKILTKLFNDKPKSIKPLMRLMEKTIAINKPIIVSSTAKKQNAAAIKLQAATRGKNKRAVVVEEKEKNAAAIKLQAATPPEEASTQTPTVPASGYATPGLFGKDDEITMIGGRKTKYRRFINKKSLRKKTNITKRKNLRKKLTQRKKLRPKKTLRKKRHFSKKKRKNYKGGNQNFCPASKTPFLNAQANYTKNLFSEIQANRRWA